MANVDRGDVPGWLAAGSIVLGVLALLQDRQRERRERERELKERQREREQEDKERLREREQRERERRRQATYMNLDMVYPADAEGLTREGWIEVENPSPEPVFKVKARVIARVQLNGQAPVVEEKPVCVEWASIAGTPPGSNKANTDKRPPKLKAIPGLKNSAWSHSWRMWFTGFQGIRWEKRDTGELREVDPDYEAAPCEASGKSRVSQGDKET